MRCDVTNKRQYRFEAVVPYTWRVILNDVSEGFYHRRLSRLRIP